MGEREVNVEENGGGRWRTCVSGKKGGEIIMVK